MPDLPPWLNINPANAVFQAAGIAEAAGERDKDRVLQQQQDLQRTLEALTERRQKQAEFAARQSLVRDKLQMQNEQLDAIRQVKENAADQLAQYRNSLLGYQQEKLDDTQQNFTASEDLKQKLQAEKDEHAKDVQAARAQAAIDLQNAKADSQRPVAVPGVGLYRYDQDNQDWSLVPGSTPPPKPKYGTVRYPAEDSKQAVPGKSAVPAWSLLNPKTWLNGAGSPAVPAAAAIAAHPAYSMPFALPPDTQSAAAALQAPAGTGTTNAPPTFTKGEQVSQNGVTYEYDGQNWNEVK